ncbi:MAG: hypothetical protein ACOYWZ_03555 [Bacillota bacterium]
MNIQPLRSYREPKYAEKNAVLDNPDILNSIPQRWMKNLRVKIAFSSLLLLTITACGSRFDSSDSSNMKEGTMKSVMDEAPDGNKGQDKAKNQEGKTAPIFQYGEGRGGFGCVSVSPPVFLSEEEAFQIISEEAKKEGIKLKRDDAQLKGIQVPVTYTFSDVILSEPENPDNDREAGRVKTKGGRIQLDGYDNSKRIGFEFVSVEDFKGWVQETKVRTSYEDYNVLEAAKTLREGIDNKTGDKHIGIFYDPIYYPSYDEIAKKDRDELSAKKRQMSEENLRQQVREFINWLKAQDII